MPIIPQKRHNPLMLSYMADLKERGYSSQRLGKMFGVSHSQMYMARERNIGPKNAETISRGIGRLLGLSERERLRLMAEIMGDPDDLLRAYLGGAKGAEKLIGEQSDYFVQVFGSGPVPHTLGLRIASKLEEIGAPQYIVDGLRERIVGKYTPPGRITFTLTGPEVADQRARSKEAFRESKPRTAAALDASGLAVKDLASRAGVGRETLRRAMYQSAGEKTAWKVARILGRDDDEIQAIVQELKTSPEKSF